MEKRKDKDYFLARWLADELSHEEKIAFEKSDDFLAYNAIIKECEKIKLPEFNEEAFYKKQLLNNALSRQNKKAKIIKFKRVMYAVAASLLLLFGFNWYFKGGLTTYTTQIAEQDKIELPDNSIVHLDVVSEVAFNEKNFLKDRVLNLKGSAFFDVEKGSQFTVKTILGNIEVLGTEFNVFSRGEVLEVKCFEGKVKTIIDGKEYFLEKGKGLISHSGNIEKLNFDEDKPYWLKGEKHFSKVKLKEIIKFIERHYNVVVDPTNIDLNRKFSGFVTSKNLQKALHHIFDPMSINFSFAGSKIILKSE